MEQLKTKRFLPAASLFGWLALACLAMFLSGGDRPIELAVWLGPVFLLRFIREAKV
jgi:hypothetical protein